MKLLMISNLTDSDSNKMNLNPIQFASNPDVFILGNIYPIAKDPDKYLALNDELKAKAINYVSGPEDCFLDDHIILKRNNVLFTHGDIVDKSFKRSNNLDTSFRNTLPFLTGLLKPKPVIFSSEFILRARYILDSNECDIIVMSYFKTDKVTEYNLGNGKKAIIVPSGFVDIHIKDFKPVRR